MSDDLKTLLSNLVLDRNQPISGLLAITVIDRQGTLFIIFINLQNIFYLCLRKT